MVKAKRAKRVRVVKAARTVKKLKRGPSVTGAPPKEKRPTHAEMFRKKKREIEIISRRTQPQWKRKVVVERLKKKEGAGGIVSSSWIWSLEWTGRGWVIMTLLNGYTYNVYIPFKIWEGWYYAHSKGTYFNYIIKSKYKVVRSA